MKWKNIQCGSCGHFGFIKKISIQVKISNEIEFQIIEKIKCFKKMINLKIKLNFNKNKKNKKKDHYH